MKGRELPALLALAAIMVITAAWWWLALAPLPAESPEWLQRTRLVCFGSTRDTLPSAAGWSLLIGQPASMLAVLAIVWGTALSDGLRALARTLAGRAVLSAGTLAALAGLGAAGARVASASQAEPADQAALAAAGTQRLDLPAPPLALVDQHGDTVTLARYSGRPVLVAFAYGHCTTVCPIAVREALAARERAGAAAPALLVVTLDPWRDTPARLPALAGRWNLGPDGHVLSGAVDEVNASLDAWEVPRSRDPATGEVSHPVFMYIVAPDGRLAYRAPAYADAVVTALRQL